MRALRKAMCIFAGILAVLAFWHAVVVGSNDHRNNIEYQMRRYHDVDRAFDTIANKIDHFRTETGRLPSDQEYLARNLGTHGIDDVPRIEYFRAEFPEEAVKMLGDPPHERVYLLAHWNGDQLNYYASWNDESTLPLDTSNWYLFGSRGGDLAASAATVLLFIGATWFLWPRTI